MAATARQDSIVALAISFGVYGTAGFISLVEFEPTTAAVIIVFPIIVYSQVYSKNPPITEVLAPQLGGKDFSVTSPSNQTTFDSNLNRVSAIQIVTGV